MDAPQTDVLSIEEIPVNEHDDLGSIALVTIRRPDKLNSLNAEVMSLSLIHISEPTRLLSIADGGFGV